MSKNKDPFKNLVLDDYEKELEASIARGEWVPMPKKEFEKEKRMLMEVAKNHIENRKRITIRVQEGVISEIKDKAEKLGMKYQSLINLVLGQYAKGQIKLAI